MNIIRSIGIVILGLVIGSKVNMALVMVGPKVIPSPAGLDITTELGLKNAMSLMHVQHFIFPFLAHALGTFVGAWIVASFDKQRRNMHYSIAGSFLLGGIMMVFQIPSPLWFTIVDLGFAYIPMAWLAGKYRWNKE